VISSVDDVDITVITKSRHEFATEKLHRGHLTVGPNHGLVFIVHSYDKFCYAEFSIYSTADIVLFFH